MSKLEVKPQERETAAGAGTAGTAGLADASSRNHVELLVGQLGGLRLRTRQFRGDCGHLLRLLILGRRSRRLFREVVVVVDCVVKGDVAVQGAIRIYLDLPDRMKAWVVLKVGHSATRTIKLLFTQLIRMPVFDI